MDLRTHLPHEIPAPHFPSPISAADVQAILDLVQTDDADLQKLVAALEARPPIAGLVTRAVNSVSLGSMQQVRSLRHAVAILGLQRVRQLMIDLKVSTQSSPRSAASQR
ncbi:HDOD domain-containing protein [Planctomicrobium piriforme]|uniref:HDOD domain-containing protein n=1 Tax=Planctomicrobium piriforme TaxID=1576369 RepID=A0A1I3HKI0_9PLAN|nr:HDOD domain-containing protein [Planctomicrobium piriforme]SFI36254.1 HDOD domain-containing protein [Planctomicrobium piriforme]